MAAIQSHSIQRPDRPAAAPDSGWQGGSLSVSPFLSPEGRGPTGLAPQRAGVDGPTFVHQGVEFGSPYPLPGVASVQMLREAPPRGGFRCFDVIFRGPDGQRVCGFDSYPFRPLGAERSAGEPRAALNQAA